MNLPPGKKCNQLAELLKNNLMKLIEPRLLIGLFVSATAVALAQTDPGRAKKMREDSSFPKIKEKIAVRHPYKMGEEIELRVPIGQAVQLDCAENPYWVKEYLVYPSKSETIWVIPLDVDGCLMRGINGESWRKTTVMLLELPISSCMTILKWELQDQTLSLRFRVSTNAQQNLREFEQRNRALGLTGATPDSKAFPPLELPETDRVAGFVRLWSEVKYNFVSFDRVPEVDWDKVLLEYLPRVQKAETAVEYFSVLAQCLALLRDGHTDVSYAGRKPYPGVARYELPLTVQLLAGQRAVIVGTVPVDDIFGEARKAEFLKADLKPGEELTHLNGRLVKDILERDIYPYICASTPQGRDLTAAFRLLLGEYGSKAVLRVKSLEGNEREVTLTRKPFLYHKDYTVRQAAPNKFECRELEGGLIYVNLHSFGSKDVVKSFQEVFPRVLKSKGLILDVRRNGGGSSANGDAIIRLLTDKPIEGERWKTRKYLPAYRAWGRKEQWYEEPGEMIQPTRETPFLGPVVVLTGPATFSAAEDFVVPLHASKRATIVGERTGGSSGQPLQIELPFGGHARVCTKRDAYPDGREFVGVGIIPGVEVHPTPADIAAGRDVVLAKGVEVVRANR